jgi:Methyltransferase domain
MPIGEGSASRYRLNWRAIHGWCDFEKIYDAAAREVPDDGILVEVGTAFGRSAAMMAERLFMHGKRGAQFYCVDTWEEGPGNTLTNHPETEARLAKLGGAFTAFCAEMLVNAPEALKIVRPVRAPSVMAAKMFAPRSVDFVFLDAAHDEESVREDIAAWATTIKPGGSLAGHDYTDPDYPGVKKVVDEFASLLADDGWCRWHPDTDRPGAPLEIIGSSWRLRRLP